MVDIKGEKKGDTKMICPNCGEEIKNGKLFQVGLDLHNAETFCEKCVDKRGSFKKSSKLSEVIKKIIKK